MSSAYDVHLYPTKAQPQLHPDNLYTNAFLRGYDPVPVEKARVLEIGCGTGLNLMPMAAEMSAAEFVGIDYAEVPVQIAKSLSERFGLRNVRFHHADICDLADDFGEFDYIIAHGFYSWVPSEARDAMWRVARGSLAPNGVIQVSYNALPGWYQTKWLREFCLFHIRNIADRDTQLREGWRLIEELASMHDADNPLATTAAQTLEKGFATAVHDELATLNQPFYLHEVVKRAENFDLKYVGDAVQKFMAGLQHLPAGERILNERSGDDELSQEQYLDFLSQRVFRQSLFTPGSSSRTADAFESRFRQCWVTSILRVGEPDAEGNRIYDAPQSMLGFHSTNPMLAEFFEQIAARDPALVPVGELVSHLLNQNSSWQGAIAAEFWDLVEDLTGSGVLQTYSRDLAVAEPDVKKPRMAGIARWEAAMGLPMTSLIHRSEKFPDSLHRGLAVAADGTRRVPKICALLASLIEKQHVAKAGNVDLLGFPVDMLGSEVLRQNPHLAGNRVELERFLNASVPVELERFRRARLLSR